MQVELRSEFPDLNIELLGCNESGEESENDIATTGIDLPWLQDEDTDQDGNSDAWQDWAVTLRDFVIVDKNNVELLRISLTTHSLAISENYERTKSLLVEATDFTVRGDLNRDGIVNLLDVRPMVDIIDSDGFQFEADTNMDGTIDVNDVEPFIELLLGS